MGDPTYPGFSVFAFLGFFIVLIPMSWHLQSWNAGTCIFMLWASLASLVEFVDSVVWNGNTRDVAPVWCDISTKFLIGAGVGIPASTMCINRRLFKIASVRSASTTYEEKRRAVYEDVAIAVVIPVIVMTLHYVVQGHRFNILENIGCTPDIFNTPAAYPLVYIWPVVLGLVSFVYAALTLRLFSLRRAQFDEFITSNNALTVNRYLRLILFCCADMCCSVPLSAFSIYINNAGVEIAPYISWANVHYNFSRVDIVPAEIWTSSRAYYISVQMGRCIYPGSAFLFFLLFGFAEEARRHYRSVFRAIMKRVGVYPVVQDVEDVEGPSSPNAPRFSWRVTERMSAYVDGLPVYTPRTPIRRKNPESLPSSLAGSDIYSDVETGPQSPLRTSSPVKHDSASSLRDPQLSTRHSENCDIETDPSLPLDSRIVISEEFASEFSLPAEAHASGSASAPSSPALVLTDHPVTTRHSSGVSIEATVETA